MRDENGIAIVSVMMFMVLLGGLMYYILGLGGKFGKDTAQILERSRYMDLAISRSGTFNLPAPAIEDAGLLLSNTPN